VDRALGDARVNVGSCRICYLLVTTALLGVWAAPVPGGAAQGWHLLEPPVDETVEHGRVLDDAPLAGWIRTGTFTSEAACEAKRREALEATRAEMMRSSRTSPLPSVDTWRDADRDRRLAQASDCVSADDARLMPTPRQ